jgi:Ca2+-binding RTX toxin-like protein
VLTYDDPGGVVFEATAPGAYDIHRSDGETDTAIGVETLAAGDQADLFLGSSAADRFNGNGGNDTFVPHGGDDVIDGGGGFDGLSMEESPSPIDVDVSAGTAVGEGSDTFFDIEIIRGTAQPERSPAILSLPGSSG